MVRTLAKNGAVSLVDGLYHLFRSPNLHTAPPDPSSQSPRWRVFLGGYVGLVGVYVIPLLLQLGTFALLAGLVLLGTYYAATDGILMAVASELLPPAELTSGLALLTTAIILSRLVASVLYGALWSWQGPHLTLCLFIAGLATAMLCAAALFSHRWPPEAG